MVSHCVEMGVHSRDLTGPGKSDLLRVPRFQVVNTPLINTLDVFSNLNNSVIPCFLGLGTRTGPRQSPLKSEWEFFPFWALRKGHICLWSFYQSASAKVP